MYSTGTADYLTFAVGKGEMNGITNVFVINNPARSESVSGSEINLKPGSETNNYACTTTNM
jgi:hypothetical protein